VMRTSRYSEGNAMSVSGITPPQNVTRLRSHAVRPGVRPAAKTACSTRGNPLRALTR
jgi:hypothetical protein